MAETVTINLPASGQTVSLLKEPLLTMFPESILAQTARDYGDTFEITNPLVTPSVLILIRTILEQGNLPLQPPPDIYTMLAALDYLNLPLLNLLVEPYYSLFRALRPEINLLQIKPVLEDPLMYRRLMREAIQNSAPLMTNYFIENGPEDETTANINAYMFVYAAYLGQAEIVAKLLRRVDPITAKLDRIDRNDTKKRNNEQVIRDENNQAL